METGFLSLEINQLTVALNKAPAKDPTVRLEFEIVNGFNVFKWEKNDECKIVTGNQKTVIQAMDVDESASEKPVLYITGFDGLLLKTNYIDLNNEVINGLSNATLVLKVVSINEPDTTAVPAAKPAKGAPVVTVPSEEIFLEISLPLLSVLQNKDASMTINDSLQALQDADWVIKTHVNVNSASTVLEFSVLSDNCIAEYVLSAKFLRWENALMTNLPPSWMLHAADQVDPKAKVQPTAAEQRTKYIDNICKLVEGQEKIALFKLEVGGSSSSSDSDGADNNNDVSSIIQQMISTCALSQGRIAFDKEAAQNVPIEEDIRLVSELWKLSWLVSPVIFFHRNDKRRFVNLAKQDLSSVYVPMTVRKMPTAEGMAAEGGEVFATGLVDLSGLLRENTVNCDIPVSLQGSDFEDQSSTFTLRMSCSTPMVPMSALSKLSERVKSVGLESSGLPVSAVVNKQVSLLSANKDAVGQLRDEISSTIERVAQEYVSLYPFGSAESTTTENKSDETNAAGGGGGGVQKSVEGRKTDFLNYLMSNGIFHELKERLKISVKQIIKERYGVRGRASMYDGSFDETVPTSSEESVESILSELYVFLMRECSVVLNSLFSDTLIGRQGVELETCTKVNDEEETISQHLVKLRTQAEDTAADGRNAASESLHLECLHFVDSSPTLGALTSVVHDVYASYGQFLLRYAHNVEIGVSVSSDSREAILQRAREALGTAMAADSNAWKVGLLLSALLYECGQQEQSEVVLKQVLRSQLDDGIKDNARSGSLESFDDFDGYDSDYLCPVDPRCYSVLAALFSLQGHTLKCRKALRLIVRSFSEGTYEPPVKEHGTPKRTVVLALADTAVYFSQFSLTKLRNELLNLALVSEDAVTTKAVKKSIVATTVPHIKHLLKLAQSEVAMSANVTDAEALAVESAEVASSTNDKIRGWLGAAKTQTIAGSNSDNIAKCVDYLLKAVEQFQSLGKDKAVAGVLPLWDILCLGKLLIGMGRFTECLSIVLLGISLYSSASLFQLAGICYLRLDQLQNAEEALLASNVMDNRNAEIWAHICLLCLCYGKNRQEEADKSLQQTLRLGLANVTLLRELATSYMANDKLQIAEDLIRRALSRESAVEQSQSQQQLGDSRKHQSSSHMRRLLGDVLAGQNQAALAIEAYQGVIGDANGDIRLKLEAADKCAALLSAIGRDEELRILRGIIASLKGEEFVVSPAQ